MNTKESLVLHYIGGPTAMMEIDGLLVLTDPTFDEPGGEYTTGPVTLTTPEGPAMSLDALPHIDLVLLSHDHHYDNLDRAGRASLTRADHVITTHAGAMTLGGKATGLEPWESVDVATPSGSSLRITATPARHGPPHGDRGPVIGFVLESTDPKVAIYVSGDTVWYEGVADFASRFASDVAVLFMGAARVAAAGPYNLTMSAEEGILAARAFAGARIVPLHFEGWAHFTEGRADIARAFYLAGLQGRLHLPEVNHPLRFKVPFI